MRYYKLKKVIDVESGKDILFVDGELTVNFKIPESIWSGQLANVQDANFFKRPLRNKRLLRFVTYSEDVFEGVTQFTKTLASNLGVYVDFEGRGDFINI